ncbi:uncharacterized protein N7473_009176 [Penicillium subrubescens]|uniref:uncharacterized protein n=1 Tax=Penicillium subrubescens TaxID=1316194 RepID=UPI0025455D22|nr:uncharacterized protein N7473_009176 [Penicillium subrubescens]KAJ5886502.1 hypothetical protein N7473_009176 [Penicillium subrubescens]
MDLDALAPRDDTSCSGSKQWYVCSAGNFRGCCASDPCTSGICFDDNVSLLHLTSAASSASSTTSSSSTSTIMKTSTVTIPTASSTTSSTTVSNTSASTTTSVSSETSSAAANSTEHSSSTTTTTATGGVAAASTGTQSSSKGPIIGGVVGGLIALIPVILLLWFCRRRRKRHGKSYTCHRRRSPSTKSLHNREMASVSKTELAQLETDSTKLHNESHHGSETASPPINSTTHSTLSTPGSTTALSSLSAPTVSPDPSEYSTLSSGILSTSSGGFARLPPLRMPNPQPPTEMEASIPKSESQTAAELSDTGFYRQRAELAAHSQSELINVPLERRRRKSPLNPGSSPSSSSGSGSSESSPRSAVDKSGSSPVTSRHTARRVVTRDGVVMGANLDRYSTIRDPERGEVKGGKKSDAGQEHVMSFMTFGGSEFEMVQRRGLVALDRAMEGQLQEVMREKVGVYQGRRDQSRGLFWRILVLRRLVRLRLLMMLGV